MTIEWSDYVGDPNTLKVAAIITKLRELLGDARDARISVDVRTI